MNLLLDTHIILWALDDNPKLSNQARELIMDAKMIFIIVQLLCGRRQSSIWQSRIKFILAVQNCQTYVKRWDTGCCQLQMGM